MRKGLDFSSFGPGGPDFQEFFGLFWMSFKASSEVAGINPTNLLRASSEWHRAHFWWQLMISTTVLFEVRSPVKVWESMRKAMPNLPNGWNMAVDFDGIKAFGKLAEIVQALKLHPNIQPERYRLNQACHGPYTEAQMEFLLERHPRILQICAGSGYFAREFARRGGDIIALDDNRAGYLRPDVFAWTKEAMELGILLQGGIDRIAEFAKGRSLLVSWAEPGGEALPEALAAYHKAGGEGFLFKPGGFVGQRISADPNYPHPKDPGENILRFFELLARYWVEDAEVPQWEPMLFENNLCAFKPR
jgi:hypothetical protein